MASEPIVSLKEPTCWLPSRAVLSLPSTLCKACSRSRSMRALRMSRPLLSSSAARSSGVLARAAQAELKEASLSGIAVASRSSHSW